MKIKISKLDAARRQLLTAIRLYFNHGDAVSIHTLAAASFKITQNLCDSNTEHKDSLTKWTDELVKPENKQILWKKFHETANFFKHAKQDSDAVLDYNPDQTEHLLYFAVYQYQQLTNEYSPEIHLFSAWYMLNYPSVFNAPEEVITFGQDYIGRDRQIFWRELLPLANEKIDKELTEL